MALALVFRNATKIQAGTRILQANYLKCISAVTTKEFSVTSCQNPSLAVNKNNGNLLTPPVHLKQIMSPQVRLMSADHSKLWPIEKGLSVGLLVLIPAAIAVPNIVLDNLISIGAVLHMHWGLEAVVVDYVRPIIVGNVLPKVALGLLYVVSAFTLGGLIYFNVNDIGVGRAIRKFWSINKK